jgi:hypothetical protein
MNSAQGKATAPIRYGKSTITNARSSERSIFMCRGDEFSDSL